MRSLSPTSRLVAVVLVAAAALVACGANSNDTKTATEGLPDTVQALTANPWVLDLGASSLKFNHFYRITIVFTTKGVVGGDGACNSYSGTYTTDGSDIVISHLNRTSRVCSPLATAADGEYLVALQAVRHVENTNRDRLKLTGNSHTLTYDAVH